MPTLENDRLVFRFPQIDEDASFSIDFRRTLRIPDSDETYPLPPGLGRFPIRHVEDHADSLPGDTTSRGGVILPMWQAEAMWLNFRNEGPDYGLPFPVAIKIAAGKINAVTGEPWRGGLHRDPQDYVVSPNQPWLDGFAVEKGVIRQFVAMPLGEGYSAEEQLTGAADWGGLQISVVPLKRDVWRKRREEWERRETLLDASPVRMLLPRSKIGLAPGGRMRQTVHRDPFTLDDWDAAAADRVFVTLVHAKDWKAITGAPAPNEPPSAADYSAARMPWFEHYGKDQASLEGGKPLAGLKSAASIFKMKTGATLPGSLDVKTGAPIPIGPGAATAARPVRTDPDLEW
ncbi:hypothetical protein P6F26_17085 [Roseibacterium sp. SDUM158017]|uniref:hypothetical protein n=1 Tax=Roseicyclus salinarum TaxID=3036773 RepID=UPI0024156C8F|nr:hypothetical protein [Roseibacterium sp. SDUM158017]MDG4650166.1 hypothetical protein [Roseibacterium sp. SDUM158017]